MEHGRPPYPGGGDFLTSVESDAEIGMEDDGDIFLDLTGELEGPARDSIIELHRPDINSVTSSKIGCPEF